MLLVVWFFLDMKNEKQRVVLIQGAFDLLNYGHIRALGAARRAGRHVIVALNSNELLTASGRWSYKKGAPVLPWWQRKAILETIRFVDQVVPADKFSPLELLEKYEVGVYVVGREWKETKQVEIAYMKKTGGRIIWTPRYKHVISTSEIKHRLLKQARAEARTRAVRKK